MIELKQRIVFLENRHLFGGLTDEEYIAVATCIEEESYIPGNVILVEGDISDKFYLIYRGSVKVTRTTKTGDQEELAILVAGDYFGEMSIKLRTSRNASIFAEKETLLFAISRKNILDFVKRFPQFKSNLDISISSRQLVRKLINNRFSLFPNEVVHYASQKHKFFLWERLSIPILIIFFAILLLLVENLQVFSIVIILLALFILLPWFYIDWANDYYIVTNERVIWLEKLVGVFDRRKEVSMSEIHSISSDSTFWGRKINTGSVVLGTYHGETVLTQLEYSQEVEAQITDQWKRLTEQEQRLEKEAIEKAIREKVLGIREKTIVDPSQNTEPNLSKKESFFTRNFSHFLRHRFEEKGVITYRKHWAFLVLQSWKRFLQMIISFLSFSGYVLLDTFYPKFELWSQINITVIVFFVAWIFISLFRWIYQYLDWSNDFFQITEEEVIDVDRTPLGDEQKRSAPLDKIISVDYDKKGLMRIVFDFGTVNINMGGGKSLTFDEVKNPNIVQQEILRGRHTLQKKNRKKEAQFPREQLAEWLDIYHQITNENGQQESALDTETNTLTDTF